MIRQVIKCEVRMDRAGSGKFGAKRGDRAHQGIDYVVSPGKEVLSPVTGTVTKHGYAYGDDLSYRIVDVRCDSGFTHRLFYVSPGVDVGERVTCDQPVGVAQDVTARYPNRGMKPHVHYQIEDEYGDVVNPEIWWADRAGSR